jgi:hypothetical protein
MPRNLVLFDLDNTICDMNHRIHLIDRADPDWDAFEKECKNDPPIESTIRTANAYKSAGLSVWLWTGRSDAVLDDTVDWLKRRGVQYDQLLMRPKGDFTATTRLKRDWLDNAPVPRNRVLCAFDDDPNIVRMLLDEGVLVYQVRRRDGS